MPRMVLEELLKLAATEGYEAALKAYDEKENAELEAQYEAEALEEDRKFLKQFCGMEV